MGFKIVIKRTIDQLRFLKWKAVNHFSKQVALNEESDVIVSLTSYGERLRTSYITIETLMHQSVRPGKVILWLANDDFNCDDGLPREIGRLQKRGLEVRIVNENIRSYKKLVYALQTFPNHKIITCDDDVVYPRNFIEDMLAVNHEFPDFVVAYRCHWMTKKNGGLAPYLSWAMSKKKGPSFNLFPTGCGGVLYPPNGLHVEVLNKNVFMELAPTADDVWFKAMALMNNVKTVMVYDRSVEFDTVPGTQEDALWKINTTLGNNKNDIQLSSVFKYYGIFGLLE